jgi:hypothetical protein
LIIGQEQMEKLHDTGKTTVGNAQLAVIQDIRGFVKG